MEQHTVVENLPGTDLGIHNTIFFSLGLCLFLRSEDDILVKQICRFRGYYEFAEMLTLQGR